MENHAIDPMWTKNPSLAWREIDGRTMIISPADSVLHELNDTGSFIWKLLDGAHSSEAIAAKMAHEYAVDPQIARADTRALVRMLAAQNLVLEVAAANGAARGAAQGVARG